MSNTIPETMQRIVLASRPVAEVTPDNFQLETVPTPTPGDGEFLVRVIWLSLDPYMRGRMADGKSYAAPVEIGAPMEGGCVGEVIASKHADFSVGEFVESRFGWQTHCISNGEGARKLDPSVAPLSTAVGVLGMPGITAYVGLNTHGRPNSGETIVVSAATGAVGSLVGQLAKAQGLRVVGIAGGADKCTYATQTLGFDACIDYRALSGIEALRDSIAAECPNGVDIYYENVGGDIMQAVMQLMNVGGRVAICGMIAWYGGSWKDDNAVPAADIQSQLPMVWRSILVNRLNINGFIIFDHFDQFPSFVDEVAPLIADGTIHYEETIAEGLASAPEAFIQLLKGGNLGKQIVAISPDPTRS